MRDFPDFVDIYSICQPSAVLQDISLISLSIGSYLELAIFREDFSSVASVNVRFSWVFYFVFICCYKLNSPHNKMRTAPACFHWGLSRLSEVTIFVTDACMLNPVLVREGGKDWSDSLPSTLENFLFIFVYSSNCASKWISDCKCAFRVVALNIQRCRVHCILLCFSSW